MYSPTSSWVVYVRAMRVQRRKLMPGMRPTPVVMPVYVTLMVMSATVIVMAHATVFLFRFTDHAWIPGLMNQIKSEIG